MGSEERVQTGFTIIEMLLVVAIVGILAAIATPRFQQIQDDQRLKTAAREVGNHLLVARALAIETGRNHIVYFATTDTTDACGNQLEDASGNPVPLLILDDASGNCCITAGESTTTMSAVAGVSWGVTFAPGANPNDTGQGDYQTGASFADPSGTQTRWVMFRPDGMPVGFTSLCATGQVGTGGGGVYVTNSHLDFAAILTPLGGVTARGFDQVRNAWAD